MIIMTADEVAAARRVGRKREIKGADVRQHNGARSKVHRTARDKAKGDRRAWRRELD